jgi:hypothetical protein
VTRWDAQLASRKDQHKPKGINQSLALRFQGNSRVHACSQSAAHFNKVASSKAENEYRDNFKTFSTLASNALTRRSFMVMVNEIRKF